MWKIPWFLYILTSLTGKQEDLWSQRTLSDLSPGLNTQRVNPRRLYAIIWFLFWHHNLKPTGVWRHVTQRLLVKHWLGESDVDESERRGITWPRPLRGPEHAELPCWSGCVRAEASLHQSAAHFSEGPAVLYVTIHVMHIVLNWTFCSTRFENSVV